MPPQPQSSVVRTLGIDLASQPTNTAACLVEWGDSTRPPRVHPPLKGLDDDALVALCEDVDAVGIDAPFGWPDAFVELVTAHRAGEDLDRDWHDDDVRRALRLRLTDRWLWRESGLGLRPPLSVSSDLIALPAMRCAGLLGRLGVTDRAGDGRVFETWPAAAMHTWTGVSTGYKGRGAAAAVRREELRQALETRHHILLRDCRSFEGLGETWLRIGLQSRRNNRRIIRAAGSNDVAPTRPATAPGSAESGPGGNWPPTASG